MNIVALDKLLEIAAAIAYLAASAGYGALLLLRHPWLANPGRILAAVGVVLQTAAIGVHCVATRHTPFTTPAETLTACAWAIALIYLALETFVRPRPTALGAFAMPLAFLALFTGASVTRSRAVSSASSYLLDSYLISLHVIAILISFSLLVLAFGCAALYVAQHRMLKRKRVLSGLFGRLPPLASLDHLAFALVALAFPLLSIGLLAGGIGLALGGLQGVSQGDPKMLGSVVIWLVYGIYLALHQSSPWRGLRANYLLLGGLAVIVFTLFVPSAHRFE